ncbi:MAG TPA: hypothetical protein VH641_02675 [Streptosporangiaceae bacterium]|jgi:hypothetical protein
MTGRPAAGNGGERGAAADRVAGGDPRSHGPAPAAARPASGTATAAVTAAGAAPALQVRGRWRGWGTQAAAAASGLGMMALPAATGRAESLAIIGLVLVAASLVSPLRDWRGTAALAALAAVLACVASRAPGWALAVDGPLIVGYLVLLDAPRSPHARATPRWLRRQLPLAVYVLAATAAVLILLVVPVPASAWLVAVGAAAGVAAAAIALPRRPRARP